MDEEIRKSWERFLNPEILRNNLICASVYIASYEILKTAIISQIKSFFTHSYDESGAKISPEYKQHVLDKNRSTLHASLLWLKEMDAIDDEDISTFKKIKNCRNELSHCLYEMVSTDGLPENFVELYQLMIVLLTKIDQWWATEVLIPCDPIFDNETIKKEEILTGNMMAIQLLLDIALNVDSDAHRYYDHFKQKATSPPSA
ncbi:hypothetical protein KS4_28730 [Poriferisphaera corsica]|uniref:Uncharacterized protein n=1 Tax=Poriferisphaera corsica TaxID=2528020 RepID=A0A517YX51_9BACT|nr:hypothetical protein [Poriferisphaera corsica]QDU34798.1 hypothetical protein KS4_28730 [Poriferisphaera corsica]